MFRYSNNDNISNDITRTAYNSKHDFSDIRKSKSLNSNDLLPLNNNPNLFKDLLNQQQYSRNTEKIDTNSYMKIKNANDNHNNIINSLTEEVSRLKNALNDVIVKDKEIQELKNKIVLLTKELQENSTLPQKIKDLEMELKFVKKKLDDEYLISSEVKSTKRDIEKIKSENNLIRKNILEMNQKTNLFKLKKLVHKHTKCDLKKLNKILLDNDITEDSFILNNIDDKLIKKVIGLLND